MDDKEDSKTVLECPLDYTLSDESGRELAKGPASGQLKKESLSIRPKAGELLYLTYRDILGFSAQDYRIRLELSSKEILTLCELGYRYEDFLRILSKLSNELTLKDLLMNESLKKTGVEMEYEHTGLQNEATGGGSGELRLYETGLVVIPEKGQLARIPYCEILDIQAKDFRLSVRTEHDGGWTFGAMGRSFEPAVETLTQATQELSQKVQAMLKILLPEADLASVRKLARFMKEGRAAAKPDVENACPGTWVQLEKKLQLLGVKPEYDFLKALSRPEKLHLGLKRDLMGDLTEEYIWFLVPICGDPKKPGNAVAMEAATSNKEGKTGKATYFFRIAPRKDYYRLAPAETDALADLTIETVNRCMLAVNFRREPIYLPDERLDEPQYHRYWFAVRKIPQLRTLRELFIGRVIHSSQEQWERDVREILAFNIREKDDAAKWGKFREEPENKIPAPKGAVPSLEDKKGEGAAHPAKPAVKTSPKKSARRKRS